MSVSHSARQEVVSRESWSSRVSFYFSYGNLYLSPLREELFYQLGLRQFGNFSRIRLDPPPSLRKLIALAVDNEEDVKEGKLNSNQIVDVSPRCSFLFVRFSDDRLENRSYSY